MLYNGELKQCRDVDTLKRLYYKFAKVCHPDHGGTKEDFQALQRDYEEMFTRVKNYHLNKDGARYEKANSETSQEYIYIINELLKKPGLHIDVVGAFIWIGGNTKPAADLLKRLGFRWSSNKKLWYKAPAGFHKMTRRDWSYTEIVDRFGVSSSINTGAGARRPSLAGRC